MTDKACVIGLLKDELSEVDLAGPSLPALKSMLDKDDPPHGVADEKYGRLVHGLLSACLQNIDDMRSISLLTLAGLTLSIVLRSVGDRVADQPRKLRTICSPLL